MATSTATTPALRVGIPAGVDPKSVRSRKQAMMAAGTSEVIAEPLAVTAAEQQHLRDRGRKKTAVVEEEPVTSSVVKTKTEKVKNAPKSNPPKKVRIGTAPVAGPAAGETTA